MATLDENLFSGKWWEVARLMAGNSTICAEQNNSGLASVDFAGKALLWEFCRKNSGYYRLTLSVFDQDLNLSVSDPEEVYNGIATLNEEKDFSLVLNDNMRDEPLSLGIYIVLYTDYDSLLILGKRRLKIDRKIETRTVDNISYFHEIGEVPNCGGADLLVLARKPVISYRERDKILLTAEHFCYDGSQLITSRPIILEQEINSKNKKKSSYASPRSTIRSIEEEEIKEERVFSDEKPKIITTKTRTIVPNVLPSASELLATSSKTGSKPIVSSSRSYAPIFTTGSSNYDSIPLEELKYKQIDPGEYEEFETSSNSSRYVDTPSVSSSSFRTRFVEEPQIIKKSRVVEEPIVTKRTRVVEEPIFTQENPIVTKKTRVVEEPIFTQENPIVTKRTRVVEEPIFTQENSIVTKRTRFIEEPIFTQEEPIVTKRTRIVEEPIVTKRTRVVEEPIVTKRTRVVEEPIVTKRSRVVEPILTEEKPIVTKRTRIVEEPIFPEENLIINNRTRVIEEPIVNNRTRGVEPIFTERTRIVKEEPQIRSKNLFSKRESTKSRIEDPISPQIKTKPIIPEEKLIKNKSRSFFPDEESIAYQTNRKSVITPNNLTKTTSLIEDELLADESIFPDDRSSFSKTKTSSFFDFSQKEVSRPQSRTFSSLSPTQARSSANSSFFDANNANSSSSYRSTTSRSKTNFFDVNES